MSLDPTTFTPTAVQVVAALRKVDDVSHHVVEYCIDRGYLDDRHQLTGLGRRYLTVLDPKE